MGYLSQRKDNHGLDDSGVNLVLKPDIGIDVEFPYFDPMKPLIFRPLPAVDETGNPIPWATNVAGTWDFSDWVQSVPIARAWGRVDKYTMLAIPSDYEMRGSALISISKFFRHHSKHPVIGLYMKYRVGFISPVRSHTLIQALVFANAGVNFQNQPKFSVVAFCGTAESEFVRQFNTKRTEDPRITDPNQVFALPSPIDISSGAMLTISPVQGGKKEYALTVNAPSPVAPNCLSFVKPWNQILNVMSYDEQLKYIAKILIDIDYDTRMLLIDTMLPADKDKFDSNVMSDKSARPPEAQPTYNYPQQPGYSNAGFNQQLDQLAARFGAGGQGYPATNPAPNPGVLNPAMPGSSQLPPTGQGSPAQAPQPQFPPAGQAMQVPNAGVPNPQVPVPPQTPPVQSSMPSPGTVPQDRPMSREELEKKMEALKQQLGGMTQSGDNNG